MERSSASTSEAERRVLTGAGSGPVNVAGFNRHDSRSRITVPHRLVTKCSCLSPKC